jgi:hypothetical protein
LLQVQIGVHVAFLLPVLHGFERNHYPAEGVVFSALDADVVGGEGAAIRFPQCYLGCLEERGRVAD